MEPLALADAVAGALALVALVAALGLYGRRLWCPPVAIGLSLRVAIVVLRAAGVPFLARDLDAETFATGSQQLVERGRGIYESGGAQRFEWYLYALRRFAGLSAFGIELLGVTVWALGAFLLLAALRRCAPARATMLLWLVAALPSGLIWTSGLLREPYEFTVVALATYCVVRAGSTAGRPRLTMAAASGCLAAGWLLHTALGIAAAAFVGAALWFEGLDRLRGRRTLLALYIGAFAVTVVALASVAASHVDFNEKRTIIADYSGSASYRTHLLQLGPLSLPVDTMVGYLLYVLSPLPWQLRGPADLAAWAEVAIRASIMAAFVLCGRGVGASRRRLLLLLAVAVQLGFSVGTLNWGTSMRHNYISLAPLVVAAGVVFEPVERWLRALLAAQPADAQPATSLSVTARRVDR